MKSSMQAKNERANVEINAMATLAGGLGAANPIPLVGDVVPLIGIWATLLGRMASIYEVEFDDGAFKILAKQAFRSIGMYIAGTYAFIGIVKWTGIGTPFAIVANGALNFAFTKAVGHIYQNAWKQGWDVSQNDLENALKKGFEEWKNQ